MTKPKAVPAPKRVRKPRAKTPAPGSGESISDAIKRIDNKPLRQWTAKDWDDAIRLGLIEPGPGRSTPAPPSDILRESERSALARAVSEAIDPTINQIATVLEHLLKRIPEQPKPEAKQPDPVLYDEMVLGNPETINRDTDWAEWIDGTITPVVTLHGAKVKWLRQEGHYYSPQIRRILRRTPRAAAEPVAEAPAPEVGVLERLGRKPFVQWSAADWQEAAHISGSIAEAYPATLVIENEQDRREKETAQPKSPVNTVTLPPGVTIGGGTLFGHAMPQPKGADHGGTFTTGLSSSRPLSVIQDNIDHTQRRMDELKREFGATAAESADTCIAPPPNTPYPMSAGAGSQSDTGGVSRSRLIADTFDDIEVRVRQLNESIGAFDAVCRASDTPPTELLGAAQQSKAIVGLVTERLATLERIIKEKRG